MTGQCHLTAQQHATLAAGYPVDTTKGGCMGMSPDMHLLVAIGFGLLVGTVAQRIWSR